MLVKVIKVNWSEKQKQALNDSIIGMFSKSMGADLNNLPKEQEIYLDPDYIAEIDTPLPEEFSNGSFAVKLGITGENNCVYIKNECFDELLKAKMESI